MVEGNREEKISYACVKKEKNHPELVGKFLRITGQSDLDYSLEYGEVTISIAKKYCEIKKKEKISEYQSA